VETVLTVPIVDFLAIVLSLTALLFTWMGIYFSYRFSKDGSDHMDAAREALSRIEEKTRSLEDHVVGMFATTLDAALDQNRKQNEIEGYFAALSRTLEENTQTLINAAVDRIGGAGEAERENLKRLIQSQLQPVRNEINATKELAKLVVTAHPATIISGPGPGARNSIFDLLGSSPKPLNVTEVADALNISRVAARLHLMRLVETGEVELMRRDDGQALYILRDSGSSS